MLSVPHPLAVLIAEEQRTLQKVLIVTIDRAADMTVCVGPLACFNIDPLADQPDLRSAVISFDQRALCFS